MTEEQSPVFDAEKINAQIEKLDYAKKIAIEFSEWIASPTRPAIRGYNGMGEWRTMRPSKQYTPDTIESTEKLFEIFMNEKYGNQ